MMLNMKNVENGRPTMLQAVPRKYLEVEDSRKIVQTYPISWLGFKNVWRSFRGWLPGIY